MMFPPLIKQCNLSQLIQSILCLQSSVVKMTQFKGCMGEASLNEKNIGLWNYAEREGQCRGCFMSPQTEETSFHFDGSGYSVVVKPLRSTSTSIVMLFKTLSPNGLLLYLASNGTVRSLLAHTHTHYNHTEQSVFIA